MPSQPLPRVSVLTPVYNGEAYLAECIESVLAQTYSNWEYVIVDNCSTDRTPEIAQAYARRDARVRVHTNTHFRLALANCNHAFRQIAPDSVYCKVIHADDWVFPNCLAEMVAVAQAHPSVGLVSAYRLEQDRVDLDGLPYPSTFLPGRTVGRMSLLQDLYLFGSPTSLLLRSDLVRSRPAMYDESTPHADTELCFELLRDHDFGFVHQVLTFQRRHNESRTSLTHRFNTRYLGNYAVFLKYGPVFLTPAEYRQRLVRWQEELDRYLARRVFDLRDREFWSYQRAELKKMGQPLRCARLLRALAIELLDFRTSLRQVRQALRQ